MAQLRPGSELPLTASNYVVSLKLAVQEHRLKPISLERRSETFYLPCMKSVTGEAYRPVRPPFSARWTEWSALLRPFPQRPDGAVSDGFREAAASAGPVVMLPGLARGDGQTLRVRRHLSALGFDTRGWGLGIDIGPTRRVLRRLATLLDATVENDGPANLVGFSMGGLFARWLAQHRPEAVRQVITVCSPFRSPLDSFFLPLRRLAPLWPCDASAFIETVGRSPAVPSTCLYTITDGTVAWSSCMDPDNPADCLEFEGAHVTMASNPAVWSMLAERLARPQGDDASNAAPTNVRHNSRALGRPARDDIGAVAMPVIADET